MQSTCHRVFIATLSVFSFATTSTTYAGETPSGQEVVNELTIEFAKLNTLPKSPGIYAKLKKLTITASCVDTKSTKKLPHWVAGLKDLVEFNIGTEKEEADRQECDLVISLPENLSALSSLRKLVIDDAFGPAGALGLTNLKLPNTLEIIALNRVNLKTIPEWIFRQEGLKRLTLQYGHIQSIPEEIGKLKNLEMLDLASNEIKDLPSAVNLLPKLTNLNLAGNPIGATQQTSIKGLLPNVKISFGPLP